MFASGVNRPNAPRPAAAAVSTTSAMGPTSSSTSWPCEGPTVVARRRVKPSIGSQTIRA